MTATLQPDEASARLTELNSLGFQLFQEKLYPQALEVLQQVVDLTSSQRGPTDPDLGVALLNRGRVYRLLERNQECEADYQKALEILRVNPAAHQGQVIWLLKNLIAMYRNTGRQNQAEPSLRELLALQRTALPPGDPQLADLLVDLGGLCHQRGALQEGVGLLREALGILERALGPDEPKTTQLRHVLASVDTPSASSASSTSSASSSSAPATGGSTTDAGQEQFNDCIRGFLRQDYPAASQRALALINAGTMTHTLLQVLLISLQRSGQTKALAKVASQVPEIAKNAPWDRTLLELTLGEGDPNAALSQAQNDEQRGQVFYFTAERMITAGQPERATELLSRAMALLPKGFDRVLAATRLSALSSAPQGQAQPGTGVDQVEQKVSVLNEQAMRLFQHGKAPEALPLFEQISALRRESVGEQHPVYARTLYDLGAVHLTLGEMDKAESCYRRALTIQETTAGPDDPTTLATRKELAGVLASKGDMEGAAVMYRDLLTAEKKLGAHRTSEWMDLALMISRFFAARNDDVTVESLLRDAVDVSRDVHGAQAAATLDVLNRLVAHLIDRRRFADAQAFGVELLNARRISKEAQPAELADALDSMAQIASGLGDSARAKALWQEALKISKTR